ncbi:hypothetical protein BKE38_08820 [Pseudoroseomonas deserti]|uniref:Uncharacterized protein n=1 Tax=Teichococcus deserti TaxID=1817963 RepID=A0A1V2H5X4_9PROT|nr:hypothetical protein [Pseudoroseomonas deserti]ONG55678.1 hypothetical protein BKE38_08820 [Pseudoroseomonas deserti]
MMPLPRRALALGALASLGLSRAAPAQAPAFANPAFAAAPPLPDSATLLLPGPENGAAALWARGLAAGLVRGLPHAVALRTTILGGPDGVTAANRFATLEAGDGRTLLVLPGLAAHARLVGESRAQYDPESWLPLCVGWQGAVLAGRGVFVPPRAAQPLRLALAGPDSPEAAALLALDLLGFPAVPVFGLSGAAAAAAIGRGEADALVMADPTPQTRSRQYGLTPWLELDTPARRDHPELLAASSAAARPAALAAAQAGFAALRLRAALMLPGLTPADSVAAWRRAALRWQEEEEKSQPAEGSASPALVGAEARAIMAALCPAPDAVLAYREWLLRRLAWRPS